MNVRFPFRTPWTRREVRPASLPTRRTTARPVRASARIPSPALPQLHQPLPLPGRHRHHRQPRLLHQRHFLQNRVRPDHGQGHRRLQGAHRLQIHARPIPFPFLDRWIRIRRPNHPRHPDHVLPFAAVVVRDPIPHRHRPQMQPRRKASHPGPCRAPLPREVIPRVGRGLLFHQPVIPCHVLGS